MLNINGTIYTVPGVYGTVEIIQLGGVTLPQFNVLLFVGTSKKGLPSTATGRKGYEVIKAFTNVADAKDFYGVCNLTKAMTYGQIGGAGVVFAVNLAPLTNAVATIKDGSAANAFDIVPEDKFWGAAGNDISLTIATANSITAYTIIPPKLIKFLSANASTTSYILALDDVEGLYVNQAIKLWSNATVVAPDSVTITAIDTVNNKITISAFPTAAFATSAYARIFQEDTDHQETTTFTASAVAQDVVDWINRGLILNASTKAYAGIMPITLAKTFVQLANGITPGTSPIATETTGGSFDTFAASAPQLFEEFRNYVKIRPRILGLLSKTAGVHAVYKTLAQTLRTAQASVLVVTGCDTGDVLLATSDAAHPIQRAKTLNSGDVVLAGMGIDYKAPYLSLAPQVAGMISANITRHNLTNDNISASSVEKTFGEFNRETETKVYLANGVLIVGTGMNGFYIVQGINTYQNQGTMWDQNTNTTYLIQQRQIVDYVYEAYKNEMEAGVGADDYGPQVAAQQGLVVLDQFIRSGDITDRKMLDAYRQSNAVVTVPQITPAGLTDFVGFILKVVIPA